MVRQNYFDISLVYAESKQAFKEHKKDGKVYVEVEPDEDYFVRIQKTCNAFQGTLLVYISVDGKSLGSSRIFHENTRVTNYLGLWTFKDGLSTDTALKFTKAGHHAQEGKRGQLYSRLLMGKVEVKIFRGIFDGYGARKNFELSWNESSLDQAHQAGDSVVVKKSLRSGKGSLSSTRQISREGERYTSGALVDVITLNYCATPGLIQVGVLPKPPLWDYHRMLQRSNNSNPSTMATAPNATSVPIITPIRIKGFCGRVDELYDLTNLEEDDDDDE